MVYLAPLEKENEYAFARLNKNGGASCQGAACRVDYFDFGLCRPCQHQFRAMTCCRCHRIQGFVLLELVFELRPL